MFYNHSRIVIGDAVDTQWVIELVYDWCIVVHQLVIQGEYNGCIIGEASDTVESMDELLVKLVIQFEYNWCTTGEVGNIIGDKVVYIWWYNWRGLGHTVDIQLVI